MKTYPQFINESVRLSSNVIQFNVKNINDDTILKFQKRYPDKWILPNIELGIIFVKDKPKRFNDELPYKVYHVSEIDNLDVVGIRPSSETESPFGYYNISFFYLYIDDIDGGSISKMDNNYLYEIDTDATNIWLEGFNEPLDGEENVTTSDYIEPKYIKKLK